ncbi:alpha/beta hydrolase [Amycolatopsis sp. 195334CR]|uniref:alpha/beta hydrolase n=1 Tax=Amycolatopsis sp. 195334CR TaxID=2814588 RepID=UPI001A8D1761|nr:alpha/beta hydrolase [Amycolatopsis sp. 195334CR]MBN6037108.1 alpha/beta fold hydrolase [Amycolatopsis sp. 195334CR]
MRSSVKFGVLAAVLSLLPVAGVAGAAQPVEWETCTGALTGECATIEVPIDWADPADGSFQLAIGRLPARDQAKRIGVLFVAPGGPGSSGIDRYTLNPGIPEDSVLRDRFDIVTFDQRGVKRSSEVRCTQALLDQRPAEFPETEAEYQQLLDYNRRLGEDCRELTGAIFDHVDTESVVRDIDAIRAALGEEKLSFYGASYGTQVGQQYAELFGGRVRAMTIDSTMDHSITSGSKYIETASSDLEGSFLAFADWCARTEGCALKGRSVRKVWTEVHAKAEAGQLPVTAEALRGELMNGMYSPEKQWFPLATRLAELADGTAAPAPAGEPKAETGQNSYQAIWCQDWKWEVSGVDELRRYAERANRAAPHTRISPFWSDVTSCLGWPSEVRNPQHRLEVRDAPKILITKAKYDVATPRAWNYEVARQLRNAALLEYEGIGHGQYNRSTCVREQVEKYLVSLKTPGFGARCAAVWPKTPEPATTADGPAERPTH